MAADQCGAEAVLKLMDLGFTYTEAADMRAQDAQTFIGSGIHLNWRPKRSTDKPAAEKPDNGRMEN